MHTLGEEGTEIVTRARRSMLRGQAPEAKLNMAPGGTQAEVTQRSLVNEGLKPKPPAFDANPEEFSSWAKCFRAFFALSVLQHGPIEEQ